MSRYGVKLPDVGEGVAEAELVSWQVAVGDRVTPESVLAEVMTDKATVEISSPVAGVITELHASPGDVLAVGAEFVGIELDGDAAASPPAQPAAPPASEPKPESAPAPVPDAQRQPDSSPPAPSNDAEQPRPTGARPAASPAVRARARSLGIDLSAVAGSGPGGRVVHDDLDRHLLQGVQQHVSPAAHDEPHVEQIRGVRRRIAQRLTQAWTDVPHITYVDAVDVTELEALRAEMNRRGHPNGAKLTVLPFLVRAMVIACGEQPRLNARYDGATETLSTFDAVHVGIATQTPDGLMVPVVRHAEARGVWDVAAEIARVSTAAREGRATPQELTGSTITITSLGALGGLVTTPLLNQPEVAIVGVNKIETRPVWRNGQFEPRLQCNLSSSFDHRIVDGWDAATFVQRLKSLLEMPALLFVDEG